MYNRPLSIFRAKAVDEIKDQRNKGIYILPNLFTTGTIFAGFYAIIAASNDKFEKAVIAIFIAMLMDGLDGRIARMTNTQSDFGAEYDSMSDVVAFGLAPALVMYEWSLSFLKADGWLFAKLGWLAAFIYAVCAALRLARFNTNIGKVDKKYFQGLASPAAAAVVTGFIYVANDWGYQGAELVWWSFAVTLFAGLLMVSNVRFYSGKDIDFKRRVPFWVLFFVVMVFVLLTINPLTSLFFIALVYALSGPLMALYDWRKRKPIDKDAVEIPADE